MKFNIVQKKERKPLTIKTKYHEYYLWAIPLIPFFELHSWYTNWQYERMAWDAKRATKVLNHILPKKLEWVEEDNAYYYCMDWDWWGLGRIAPIGHRKWAKKFRADLHRFVAEGYENPDYTKTVEKTGSAYYDETWVKFVEK